MAVQFAYDNDTVYFAQANASQLIPNGFGMGTYDLNGTVARDFTTEGRGDTQISSVVDSNSAGSLLRYALVRQTFAPRF